MNESFIKRETKFTLFQIIISRETNTAEEST